ncbi:MAG: hypothetical protein JW803_09165 [Endomicrobiales bacterium]|nr:hypothetical protein [Endomicrobiales bacterium]
MIEEKDISIADIIGILRKRWQLVLLPGLIAAFAVYLYTLTIPKAYMSYALLRPGMSGTMLIEGPSETQELMDTLTMREEICKNLGNLPGYESPDALKDSIKYKQVAGFLRIEVETYDPEVAEKIVRSALNITYKRHQKKYKEEKLKLDRLVKYVKDTIKPIPLSSGIKEFRVDPSEIALEPVLDRNPIPVNKVKIVLYAFFIVFFLSVIYAFYLESKGGH